MSRSYPTVFRVGCILDRAIAYRALSEALDQTWQHYPHFSVHLRRGVFWHYLEECSPGQPRFDDQPPCSWVPRFGDGQPLIRVLVRGRTLSVEASHAVTDGMGATAFLKTLLVAYFACLGHPGVLEQAREQGIGVPGTPPAPGEQAYSSRKIFRRMPPHPADDARAWHMDDVRVPQGHYHATTMTYPVEQVKGLALSLGVSVTDLFVALAIQSLQSIYWSRPRRRRHRRPIRIMIPVDLRPHTGASTTRNFFAVVLVGIDQRLGSYTMEEIARSVHHQLRAQLDSRILQRQSSRNVSAERHPFVRILPLPAKSLILRLSHVLWGESVNTASLSNLGVLRVPQAVSDRIQGVLFVPPVSRATGANVTLASTERYVSCTVGSSLAAAQLEQQLAGALAKHGLVGRLYSTRGTAEAPGPVAREAGSVPPRRPVHVL